MEFISTGLYKEHLASYNIQSTDGVHFIATLLKYKGSRNTMPPFNIVLIRQRNKWRSDADKELMSFLVNDIAGKLKKESNSNKEKSKHSHALAHNAFASGIHEITYKTL